MAKFACNNFKHSSTKLTTLELKCSFHSWLIYENKLDPRLESRKAEIAAKELTNLLSMFKNNQKESREAKSHYHNKSVKEIHTHQEELSG